MPFAQVHITEGHTAEQKRVLIEKITQAVHDSVGAPKPNIRVWLRELPKADYGIGGTQVEALDDANAPFAQMFMMEGRTEEQKAAVIDLVSQAFVDALGAALEKTRVWITEVPKTNWGIGGKTAKSIGR